jgi:spore germination cell wall hydrolase CwlJ-like protein
MKILRNSILLYIMAAALVSTTVVVDVMPTAVLETVKIVSISANALQCMAENIYHEARGEPDAGKLAVAHVVLNRAKARSKTVCEIIREPAQFSWYDGTAKRIRDLTAFEKSKEIAIEAMVTQEDNTDGAMYFHATYVKPYWSKVFTRTVTIGDHVFYKD